MTALDIRTEATGTPVIRLGGDLELHTVGRLRGCIEDFLPQVDPGAVVLLDLREVGFMDSSGLSALISVHKQLTAHGAGVRLADPPSHVRRMLEITGLLELFGG
jgi:anti-sigma B factor antagonist